MGRKVAPARPKRGEVYKLGTRPVVVVSNDLRNGALPSVVVARVTATAKPSIPSIVELPIGEPVVGRVVCDQLTEVSVTALGKQMGQLSRTAMRGIDTGLRVALGL